MQLGNFIICIFKVNQFVKLSNFQNTTEAQLLEAWLALTSVLYVDNILVLILLNQWLKLTML